MLFPYLMVLARFVTIMGRVNLMAMTDTTSNRSNTPQLTVIKNSRKPKQFIKMISPGASYHMSPETHRLIQELARKNDMPGMTIKLDQYPDREEDSPRHEQISKNMLFMAGKYKGQNITTRGVY